MDHAPHPDDAREVKIDLADADDLGTLLAGLSTRERQVVSLAGEGRTDEQIAQALGLSTSTINSYWVRIRGKVGQFSRTDLVARVIRHEALAQNAALREETRRLKMEVERLSQELREALSLNSGLWREAWQFRALIHLPEAVLVTGPPANVVYANRRAVRLYGARSGELEGLAMRDLSTAETPEALREPCREMLEPGGPAYEKHGLESPYYARRRDGSNFRAILRAERFDTPVGPFVTVTVRPFLEEIDAALEALRRPLAA